MNVCLKKGFNRDAGLALWSAESFKLRRMSDRRPKWIISELCLGLIDLQLQSECFSVSATSHRFVPQH